MILLDASKYDKVINPLNEVTINTLFAHAVVERKVDGAIYVDNDNVPETFYIYHPYGMSLFLGMQIMMILMHDFLIMRSTLSD